MENSGKSDVPEYLQYRDRGHMYFPKTRFIPFIKAVDKIVLEYANELSFKEYGAKLVEVTTKQVRQNEELECQFNRLVQSDFDDFIVYQDSVHEVYLELTRKLCNTRIQEYLDSHQQAVVAVEGKRTLSGQNLRDTLLAHHVSSKS